MNATALAILAALFGLILLALACQRLIHARYYSATGHILSGFALLIAAALTFVVSLNLGSYASTTTTAVAEIGFKKNAEQSYRVTLVRLPAGDQQVFTLNGDDWQLDARILKWQDWASSLGLDKQFRLERLSARYREAPKNPPSAANVYELSGNPGFDVWQWAIVRPEKPSFLDPVYGSTEFFPMGDGIKYRVAVGEDGLIVNTVGTVSVGPK